jgi:ADP-ribose pyrophosphatase
VITTLSSRLVYENRWMRLREDAIRRPDGSDGIYAVVEKADFVVVVPLEDDGSVHLVEQYRYPLRGRFWELPQGAWEQVPEADPLAVARGELQEETGLVAGRMSCVGRLFQGCGFSTQEYRVFLAQDLRPGERRPDRDEQDLVTRRFTAAAFAAMLRDGTIRDANTLAAIGLLAVKGLLGLA